MRIVLLNQFFWPDAAATSQLLTDVARDLAERGHDVHAICAATSYAGADDDRAPSVTIHRVGSFGFGRSKIGRILSYGSFYLGAAFRSLLITKPDVVLSLTTPPLISLIGNLLQILRGAKHWIWEMDMYPDVAVDLGYMKAGGSVETSIGILADWSRKHSTGIIALGDCMKERLISRGVNADKIRVCDNWADSRAIKFIENDRLSEEVKLLYSGNLGLAHDLDTLTGAIKRLAADQRFKFLFVGGGGRITELAAWVSAEEIDSVQFLPYAKRAELSKSLSVGDIGLVTQRSECCGSVVPSKVYGLMAAGRPFLFVGPAAATPARIIKRFQCGWHISCGDVDGLTTLLIHLAEQKQEIRAAGVRGRSALLQNFDRPIGLERITSILLTGEMPKSQTSTLLTTSPTLTQTEVFSNSQ